MLISTENPLAPAAPPSNHFQTTDDVRLQLIADFPTEVTRVDSAISLTQGLTLIKQYELSKSFLQQVQQEKLLPTNNSTLLPEIY